MFTNFILRPPTSLTIQLSPPLKPFAVVTIRRIAVAAFRSISPDETLPYGPSLSKGHNPPISPPQDNNNNNNNNNNNSFDETQFTRVFTISAIRVPADQCFGLESQLRGHLLNWPRVRNIARVSGDEIDPELQKYFTVNDTEAIGTSPLDTLDRRIHGKAEHDGERLSPVLYRDKLVKTFNSRGYEKFRNLAKLSRPKRKAKTKDGINNNNDNDKRGGCYLVEVVDDGGDGEDLSGLIGVGRFGKWRGSTRLLLLDERYACKVFDEMPESVKVFVLA